MPFSQPGQTLFLLVDNTWMLFPMVIDKYFYSVLSSLSKRDDDRLQCNRQFRPLHYFYLNRFVALNERGEKWSLYNRFIKYLYNEDEGVWNYPSSISTSLFPFRKWKWFLQRSELNIIHLSRGTLNVKITKFQWQTQSIISTLSSLVFSPIFSTHCSLDLLIETTQSIDFCRPLYQRGRNVKMTLIFCRFFFISLNLVEELFFSFTFSPLSAVNCFPSIFSSVSQEQTITANHQEEIKIHSYWSIELTAKRILLSKIFNRIKVIQQWIACVPRIGLSPSNPSGNY